MSDDDRDVDAPPDPGTAPVDRLAPEVRARVLAENQRRLRHGIRLVRELIAQGRVDYAALCQRADRLGHEPPGPDQTPVAWAASWVELAAGKLVETDCAMWVSNDELRALGEDLAGPGLAAMRALPEHNRRMRIPQVEDGHPIPIELRWTLKPFVRRTPGEADEPRCGRAKVVPESERLTWRGGDAPYFRFELSLPWFLLADQDEIEHGLHDLLCACRLVGREEDPKPKLGKPDIVAYAQTLGRFGARFAREVRAVVHAQAHPDHRRLARVHDFDPATGQGLIWGDLETHRRAEARKAEADPLRRVPVPGRKPEPPRTGKDAAAEQGGFDDDPDVEEVN